jgi:hypothetical protein
MQDEVKSEKMTSDKDKEETFKAATHSTDQAPATEPPHVHLKETTGRAADDSWKKKGDAEV